MNKLILSLSLYFIASLNTLIAQCSSGFDWSHTNCSAYGVCDGTITIWMPDGGTLPYTFKVDNGTTSITEVVNDVTYTFTGLCAGTYDLFAWDSDSNPCDCVVNCGNVGTPTVTITQPDPPELVVECYTILPYCLSIPYTGPTHIVTFSGGVGPYTVNGNSATSPYQTYEFYCFGNVPTSATVEDAAGQSVTASCVVSSDGGGAGTCYLTPTPSFKVIPTCKNVCGGELWVYFDSFESGAPYEVYINSDQYMFNAITDTVKLTGLCEGNVFDLYAYGTGAHTCPAFPNYSITIDAVNNPSLSVQQEEISCYNVCDGELTFSASSGTSPYAYSINGGSSFQSNNTVTGLCENDYDCIVKDINGCVSATSTITLQEPEEISISIVDITDVDCFGNNTGAIDISVTGGTGAYAYDWDNNANTEDVDGLVAGSFSIVVSDENNCSATISVDVVEPDELVVNGFANDEILGEDGSITVDVEGGVPSYTFSWSGPDGFESLAQNLTGLKKGEYNLVVKDNNDCETVFSIFVGSQLEVKKMVNDSFKIYPNPNNGRFGIVCSTDELINYSIYNSIGQVVHKSAFRNETSIDIQLLGRGIYVLQLESYSTKTTAKIVVTN